MNQQVFFSQRLALLAVFLSTFVFSLMWQFNQFAMLAQALGLFVLDALGMLPTLKVSTKGHSAQTALIQCPCRKGQVLTCLTRQPEPLPAEGSVPFEACGSRSLSSRLTSYSTYCTLNDGFIRSTNV